MKGEVQGKKGIPHDDNDESTPKKKPKIDYNDDIPDPEPGEDFPPSPLPVKKITYHWLL